MKEKKFKIYERCWDLTNYSKYDLEKYNLDKGVYVYIGKASEKTYLSNRNSCWRNKYKNKALPDKIQCFIENLERFYRSKNYLEEEIDKMIFNSATVIAYCENNTQLDMMELAYITKIDLIYKMIQDLVVEEPVILLNSRNSNVKQEIREGLTVTSVNPFI